MGRFTYKKRTYKVTYQVPKTLYQTIANYIELTKFHTNNVIKTLIRTDV